MAMENPHITADVIEAQEFPDLARLYSVMAVPKTVINGTVQFIGAVSERTLLKHVLAAIGEELKGEDDEEEVVGPTSTL
jgi:alkyl hydroperoxide reductase subunit AhpF